jgi:hypothetical protein
MDPLKDVNEMISEETYAFRCYCSNCILFVGNAYADRGCNPEKIDNLVNTTDLEEVNISSVNNEVARVVNIVNLMRYQAECAGVDFDNNGNFQTDVSKRADACIRTIYLLTQLGFDVGFDIYATDSTGCERMDDYTYLTCYLPEDQRHEYQFVHSDALDVVEDVKEALANDTTYEDDVEPEIIKIKDEVGKDTEKVYIGKEEKNRNLNFFLVLDVYNYNL